MTTYLYRLRVSWPDPADEYQWGRKRQLNYLSRGGAAGAAQQLRSRGAVVDVVRSLPVQWPLECRCPDECDVEH